MTTDPIDLTTSGTAGSGVTLSNPEPTTAELQAQVAELQRELAAAQAQSQANTTPPAITPDPAQAVTPDQAPPVALDPAPPVPGSPAEPAAPAPTLTVGDLVSHSYWDPYSGAGGIDATVRGIVLELVDLDPQADSTSQRKGAIIGWFRDISDPIDTADLTPAGAG